MGTWSRDDAWIFLAATMRGRVDIRTLDRSADYMMHSRPNPTQVSASLSKLIGAGLFHFDGRAVRAHQDAFAIGNRAQSSTEVSPWEPGGWIDRALAELENYDVRHSVEPPVGFASWYDVIAQRRTGRWRRLATRT